MSRFERWAVWGTTVLTVVSGTGYLWMKYFMEPADPFAVVSHPLEPWFLRGHVITAPFFVFAVGLITTNHVWRHLRDGVRWARASGLASAGTLALMVLTGYLIQVVTGEAWLEAVVIVHIASGYAFLLALGVHEWRTKAPPGARQRRRRRRTWPVPAAEGTRGAEDCRAQRSRDDGGRRGERAGRRGAPQATRRPDRDVAGHR